MAESSKTRFMRWGFNLFPAYRRTGGRITYIAHDLTEVRIRLALNWKTRNYVGTLFGGSMYAAIDPIYMMMLTLALGKGYRVWDKQAVVNFKKPGRTTLYALFKFPAGELDEIRSSLAQTPTLERTYTVQLRDSEGAVYVECEKHLHIRKLSP